METHATDKINSFDSLFTTDHIRMLKVLLSQISPPYQGRFAIYIRFLELSYTLRFFHQNPYAGWSPSGLCMLAVPDRQTTFAGQEPDILATLEELLPYCNLQERNILESLKNTLQSMENIQQTFEMFEMMQDVFPEFFHPDTSGETAGTGSGASAAPFGGMDFSQLSQILDMMQNVNHEQNP